MGGSGGPGGAGALVVFSDAIAKQVLVISDGDLVPTAQATQIVLDVSGGTGGAAGVGGNGGLGGEGNHGGNGAILCPPGPNIPNKSAAPTQTSNLGAGPRGPSGSALSESDQSKLAMQGEAEVAKRPFIKKP